MVRHGHMFCHNYLIACGVKTLFAKVLPIFIVLERLKIVTEYFNCLELCVSWPI